MRNFIHGISSSILTSAVFINLHYVLPVSVLVALNNVGGAWFITPFVGLLADAHRFAVAKVDIYFDILYAYLFFQNTISFQITAKKAAVLPVALLVCVFAVVLSPNDCRDLAFGVLQDKRTERTNRP